MFEVIDHLKQLYDVVIIDSPVVLSVPDTVILASRAEAVIFVHRPGTIDRRMVRQARLKLDEVKARILGLVLNNVDVAKEHYYYPSHLYYGYGADEEEKVRKDPAGKRP